MYGARQGAASVEVGEAWWWVALAEVVESY